jgi:RHS repeat-associated protein
MVSFFYGASGLSPHRKGTTALRGRPSSGGIAVSHYDKEGRVISETDQNGNRIRDNVYLNGKLVAEIGSSGEIRFYHTDPAGTPLAMTDVNGSVVWRADYRPFGEEQIITEAVSNNYQFTGKEKDEETGLHYFGARYLESKIGRFVSPDPVGAVDSRTGSINEKVLRNPQRINLYAYALNNPYRYIDLDGNEDIELPLLERIRNFVDNPSAETARRLFDPLGSLSFPSSPEHNDMGINRTKDVYEIAKAGGRNAGYLNEYRNRSTGEVQGALKGHEKQVEIHREKIAHPEKAGTRTPWESMSKDEQERTLRDWGKHMQRNKEQADIMRGILRERRVNE